MKPVLPAAPAAQGLNGPLASVTRITLLRKAPLDPAVTLSDQTDSAHTVLGGKRRIQ